MLCPARSAAASSSASPCTSRSARFPCWDGSCSGVTAGPEQRLQMCQERLEVTTASAPRCATRAGRGTRPCGVPTATSPTLGQREAGWDKTELTRDHQSPSPGARGVPGRGAEATEDTGQKRSRRPALPPPRGTLGHLPWPEARAERSPLIRASAAPARAPLKI